MKVKFKFKLFFFKKNNFIDKKSKKIKKSISKKNVIKVT